MGFGPEQRKNGAAKSEIQKVVGGTSWTKETLEVGDCACLNREVN